MIQAVKKSRLNRESNPGPLANRANTLTTELSRHTEKTTKFHYLTCIWLKSVRITKDTMCIGIYYMIERITHITEHSYKHRIREGYANDR